MRPLLVLAVLLCVPSPGHGQFDASVDAQTRAPSLGPRDLLLVRRAGAAETLETAFGFDVDVIRRPVLVVNEVIGTEREAVATRATATFLYGVGLGQGTQANLAVPLVYQEGEGRSAFTTVESDQLPAAAVGDTRLELTWAAVEPDDATPWGLGVGSGLSIPTGDEEAFAGGPGVTGWLGVFGERVLGPLHLVAEVGIRAREESEVGDSRVASQVLLAGGAALSLLSRRLVLAVSAQTLPGLVSGSPTPSLALFEARVRPVHEDPLEIAVGVGAGSGEGITTPEWELIFALRHVPH